jgi:hypothetical protein
MVAGKCSDPIKEAERIRKMAETKRSQHRRVVHSEEARKKMSEANLGVKHHQYGKPISDEVKQKISITMSGRKRPQRSPEWCRKISEGHKGKRHTMETRMKMSKAQLGEKAKLWKGGLSYGLYCKDAKPSYKRVRAYFSHCCVRCGQPQTKEKLCVHHVDYDKEAGCKGKKFWAVTLCRSCHTETNNNREYWESQFKEMITNYYGGKCMLTEQEFKDLYSVIPDVITQ